MGAMSQLEQPCSFCTDPEGDTIMGDGDAVVCDCRLGNAPPSVRVAVLRAANSMLRNKITYLRREMLIMEQYQTSLGMPAFPHGSFV